MARIGRPKTVLITLVFFFWVDGRTLGTLILPKLSASYHFYAGLGATSAHFVLGVVTVALAITATTYLWRPIAGWAQASLVAIAAYAVQTVVGVGLMVRNLPLAREAWLESRRARGLPLHEKDLDVMFSPNTLWFTALVTLVLLAALSAAIWRQRAYEAPDAAPPS